MKHFFPYVAILIIGVLLYLVFSQTLRSPTGAELAPLVDNIDVGFFSAMFTYLLFASVVVERFLEIIVGTHRELGKLPYKKAVENAQEELQGNPNDKSTRQQLRDAKERLAEYREDTKKLALRVGFLIGLVIAIVGVGVFRPIFDISEYPDWQAGLFWAVDCVLTAGLIAGGSSGISKMNDALVKGLERMKEPPNSRAQL